jgi:hypothetical protein
MKWPRPTRRPQAGPKVILLATLVVSALVACDRGSLGSSGSLPEGQDGSIFREDFESGTLAEWQDGVDPSRHRIVTDAASAQSGSRYLVATYPAGRDGGGWLTRFLLPGHDSLYVSFYVRFPANWQGGTKLLGLYGSRTDDQWSAFGKAAVCPDGTDFFTAMLLTEPGGNPGPVRFYTYYPSMAREPDGVTCWGRYGTQSTPAASYASSLILSRGAWHHVEFSVRLNTPGQADGHQAFWIDDAAWGNWPGLSFRDSEMLRLNSVQLSFSQGAGVPQAQELHVDNLLVRTVRPRP